MRLCEEHGLDVALADVWGRGGAGAERLSTMVASRLGSSKPDFAPLYPDEMPLRKKIETVATEIYRAPNVEFSHAARTRLAYLTKRGYGKLPVCIAKTQYSFSDNPELLNAPSGHTLTIRDVKLSAGAGFVVAYAGTLLTMPGLPRIPSASMIDIDDGGNILGLS